MQALSQEIVNFLQSQGFVIISTLDADGSIHCSAKGIVTIDEAGKVYLIDLYLGSTFHNLKTRPTVSITAVDERRFMGYSLKGKATIIAKKDFDKSVIGAWQEKIIQRISKRLIKNVQDARSKNGHPEAHLPAAQYLIAVEVEKIIDLTPAHIKNQAL
jgi:predicted pyridoxine 5'-phosphate oxidase superfamily flavin-nucleotide-binding protein